jgi:flavodoxin
MSKTVVVYHSGYGHTQRVAQFVAEGAKAQTDCHRCRWQCERR